MKKDSALIIVVVTTFLHKAFVVRTCSPPTTQTSNHHAFSRYHGTNHPGVHTVLGEIIKASHLVDPPKMRSHFFVIFRVFSSF